MIKKYTIAWFGMMALAVVNGTIRDFCYKPYVGDLAAHQISTMTLLLLMAGYFWWLARVWPIRSAAQAWTIGIIWFFMTEIFEFSLGLRRGMSLGELLHAYDLSAGQVWLFIPIWVLIGPYLFYRYRSLRTHTA